MKLSAPIYTLKRQARLAARAGGIPLHEALDQIAQREGFHSWSLLAARHAAASPARTLLASLAPGDLALIGARPGHGKTLLALELVLAGIRTGRQGAFFTLEYGARDIVERLRALGEEPAAFNQTLRLDCSDEICASYLAQRLEAAPVGTLVAVDFMQALDHKRENPSLAAQIQALKAFARERGLIMVLISQIDRSYDPGIKPCPGLEDVRLPNPLDLSLFDKACFLNGGEMRLLQLHE